MDGEKKISSAVINRLPRYYRYLGDLLENDINRISSKELSEKMNITCLLYTSIAETGGTGLRR